MPQPGRGFLYKIMRLMLTLPTPFIPGQFISLESDISSRIQTNSGSCSKILMECVGAS